LQLEALEGRYLLTTYTITDLGVLPGGSYSAALAINNEGQIVGYSNLMGSSNHNGFRYQDGHMSNLGLVPGFVGGEATALSDSGNVVGNQYKVNPVTKHHGAIYNDDGSITDVPPLGSNSCNFFGVNNGGDVVGYSETDQGLPTHAVLYTGGQLNVLGMLQGDMFSWAYAINDAGLIVGKSGGDHVNHAFIYLDGTMTDLGTLGGPSAIADAITNNNLIAGYSTPDDTGLYHAFLLAPDSGMVDLGVLPGDTSSYARGLNSLGQVVGVSQGSGTSTAFVYQDGQMSDLNSLVVNGDNWTLLAANGINDSGVIVGQGSVVLGDGTVFPHAFMLTPTSGTNVALGQQVVAQISSVSAAPILVGAYVPLGPMPASTASVVVASQDPAGPGAQFGASLAPQTQFGSDAAQDAYFATLGDAGVELLGASI
jgi:probable HAF family extracellular repeat protein